MSYNVALLQEQIDAAGIPNEGVRSDGHVYILPAATPEQVTLAAQIVAAHEPALLAKTQEIEPALLAKTQEIEAARAALVSGKKYLQRQLLSVTPDTPAALVTAIKPVVDGNAYLTRMMSNQIALMNGAFGWTLDLNPVTAQNRQRYIMAVEAVIALLG